MQAQSASQHSAGSTAVATTGEKAPALTDAKRDKILTYIRERFGVPDVVKLTMGALHPSTVAPGFNEAAVNVDDGKTQHSQEVLVSADSRFLILVMGAVMELKQNTPAEMTERVHETFKTGADLKLSISAFKPSPSPEFEQGTLIFDNGKTKQDRTLLRTKDGKHLILSDLYSWVWTRGSRRCTSFRPTMNPV